MGSSPAVGDTTSQHIGAFAVGSPSLSPERGRTSDHQTPDAMLALPPTPHSTSRRALKDREYVARVPRAGFVVQLGEQRV